MFLRRTILFKNMTSDEVVEIEVKLRPLKQIAAIIVKLFVVQLIAMVTIVLISTQFIDESTDPSDPRIMLLVVGGIVLYGLLVKYVVFRSEKQGNHDNEQGLYPL
ncbi:MAG: hypothetical protein RTV31_04050 [Candidatus Thorarchaeota archaeon]